MYTKRFYIFLALVAAIFIAPATASAASTSMTFTVVDDTGMPQRGADVTLTDSQGRMVGMTTTDENGVSYPLTVTPGQTVVVRRDRGCPSFDQPSPAGQDSYLVPQRPPASKTIVIDSISHPDYVATDSSDTPDERGLIGLINQMRSSKDLSNVESSTLLHEAAARYAGYVASYNGSITAETGHCLLLSAHARAMDSGFYGSLSEVIAWSSDLSMRAGRAMNGWMQSAPHRTSLTREDATVVGVGSASANGRRVYVALIGYCSSEVGCGATGDYGDPSLAKDSADDPDDATDPPAAQNRTKVRLIRATHKGNRVKMRLRLSRRVSVNSVVARGKQGGRRLRARSFAKTIVVRGRVSSGVTRIRLSYRTPKGRAGRFVIKVRVGKSKRGRVPARLLRAVEK